MEQIIQLKLISNVRPQILAVLLIIATISQCASELDFSGRNYTTTDNDFHTVNNNVTVQFQTTEIPDRVNSTLLEVDKSSRTLPPKVVGGAIGGGLGGGIGGAIGGGVGYVLGGPVGGGVGGAVGGGVGGVIGGKIGGGNGAAIGAGIGGAIGGGIGGFIAGPIGGGLGGLLGGGTGGGLGAYYIPDEKVTREEDVPGFPAQRNNTIEDSVSDLYDDYESFDKLAFERKSSFSERIRQRVANLRDRFQNLVKNGTKSLFRGNRGKYSSSLIN